MTMITGRMDIIPGQVRTPLDHSGFGIRDMAWVRAWVGWRISQQLWREGTLLIIPLLLKALFYLRLSAAGSRR
jgi:hypothetical protein